MVPGVALALEGQMVLVVEMEALELLVFVAEQVV